MVARLLVRGCRQFSTASHCDQIISARHLGDAPAFMVTEAEGNLAVENVSMLSAYDPNRQSPDRVKSCTFSFTNETG
jgi:hypothetical protein